MTLSAPRTATPHHAAHRAGTVSPTDQATLWEMEEQFWTNGLDSARATTATNAVMVFSYPPGILQGDQIWNHLRDTTGWRTVRLGERRIMRCEDIAILTYRVTAEKPDVPVTKALCASTYLHDEGSWLRIAHQQTPVT